MRTYLFVCLHDDISSFRLFRKSNSGLQIIKYFSQRESLHRFEAGLYGVACFKLFQVTLTFVEFSFKSQTCLLSSVLFVLFELENDALGVHRFVEGCDPQILSFPFIGQLHVLGGRLREQHDMGPHIPPPQVPKQYVAYCLELKVHWGRKGPSVITLWWSSVPCWISSHQGGRD